GVGFELVVLLVVPAVVPIAEPNRSDIAGSDPSLPYLVLAGAHGIASCINRLTGRQQGEMPIARPTVIRESVQSGVARQVAGLQGDGAPGRVTDQVIAQRGDEPDTVGGSA